MAPLVWWGGGALLAGLAGLRVRAVLKKKPAASGAAAPVVTPQQVAAVTPQQVQQAAAASGFTVQQFSQAAQAAGTTPQAVIAQAQETGSSVADAIIAAQNGAPSAQAAALSLDPSIQAQVNPDPGLVTGTRQTARVTTNDPAPAGDLIIRSAPSQSAQQIGGAEKDGVVFVLEPDAGTGFTKIEWPGGSRLPPATGFAHTNALSTSFNGEGSPDASEVYGKDYA